MTDTILGYPVIGEIEVSPGVKLPVVDIPMMSDEEWQRSANEQVVKQYTRAHGRAPESLEAAYAWRREWIAGMEVME